MLKVRPTNHPLFYAECTDRIFPYVTITNRAVWRRDRAAAFQDQFNRQVDRCRRLHLCVELVRDVFVFHALRRKFLESLCISPICGDNNNNNINANATRYMAKQPANFKYGEKLVFFSVRCTGFAFCARLTADGEREEETKHKHRHFHFTHNQQRSLDLISQRVCGLRRMAALAPFECYVLARARALAPFSLQALNYA